MAKNYMYLKPKVIACEPYTAEEQETRYKKDYEFNKPVPVRSPAFGWEDKYIRQGDSSAPPKEVSMVKGTPHKFKGVRSGSVYSNRPTRRRSK